MHREGIAGEQVRENMVKEFTPEQLGTPANPIDMANNVLAEIREKQLYNFLYCKKQTCSMLLLKS